MARGFGRTTRVAAVIGAVAVAGGGAAWLWSTYRNTSTPVSISDLIEGFDEVAGDTLAVEGLADPGVYGYATRGSERIDALTKPERAYPAETGIVMRASGCGMRVEWRPLEERIQWWEMCVVDGGIALVRYGGAHEFFGTRDERTLECAVGTWLLPPAEVAPVTEAVCSTGSMDDLRRITVVGPAEVVVAGRRVTGIEVRVETSSSGDASGEGTATLVLTPRGLPLSWSEESVGRSDTPLGVVTQTESFSLTLTGLSPVG